MNKCFYRLKENIHIQLSDDAEFIFSYYSLTYNTAEQAEKDGHLDIIKQIPPGPFKNEIKRVKKIEKVIPRQLSQAATLQLLNIYPTTNKEPDPFKLLNKIINRLK